MTESKWVFGCQFGLSQDDCKSYESDPEARGYGRYDGCPSCLYREPANGPTALAEDAWQREKIARLILDYKDAT